MGEMGPPGAPGPLQALSGREDNFVGPRGVPGQKGDKVQYNTHNTLSCRANRG